MARVRQNSRNNDTAVRTHEVRTAVLRGAVVAAVWLVVWELGSLAIGHELLLPSPVSVARSLARMVVTGEFWSSIARSMSRILLGYAMGAVGGIALGVLTSRWRAAAAFFAPAMSAVKATPVASFVILLLAWIRGANLSIAVSTLMVLPLVWQATHTGLGAADPQLLEMARAFGIGRIKVLRYIVLPPMKQQVLAALRTALGFAWKAGVAGEVIAVPSGTIGMHLYNAKVYLEMPDMFAWTAVIVLTSVLLEKLLVFLSRGGERKK